MTRRPHQRARGSNSPGAAAAWIRRQLLRIGMRLGIVKPPPPSPLPWVAATENFERLLKALPPKMENRK